MHRQFARSALAVAGASVVAVAIACSDSTGPSGSKHPIVGTYELTSVMQSYTSISSCVDYYHCTFETVPISGTFRSGTALSGTLVIDDSVVTEGADSFSLPSYSASLTELQPCNATDPSCTPPGYQRVVAYVNGSPNLTVTGDTMGVTGSLEGDAEMVRLTTGTFAGDSIAGTMRWYTQVGPRYAYYSGTFVARRHR